MSDKSATRILMFHASNGAEGQSDTYRSTVPCLKRFFQESGLELLAWNGLSKQNRSGTTAPALKYFGQLLCENRKEHVAGIILTASVECNGFSFGKIVAGTEFEKKIGQITTEEGLSRKITYDRYFGSLSVAMHDIGANIDKHVLKHPNSPFSEKYAATPVLFMGHMASDQFHSIWSDFHERDGSPTPPVTFISWLSRASDRQEALNKWTASLTQTPQP